MYVIQNNFCLIVEHPRFKKLKKNNKIKVLLVESMTILNQVYSMEIHTIKERLWNYQKIITGIPAQSVFFEAWISLRKNNLLHQAWSNFIEQHLTDNHRL